MIWNWPLFSRIWKTTHICLQSFRLASFAKYYPLISAKIDKNIKRIEDPSSKVRKMKRPPTSWHEMEPLKVNENHNFLKCAWIYQLVNISRSFLFSNSSGSQSNETFTGKNIFIARFYEYLQNGRVLKSRNAKPMYRIPAASPPFWQPLAIKKTRFWLLWGTFCSALSFRCFCNSPLKQSNEAFLQKFLLQFLEQKE